jgi:hypothetical protein
MFLFIIGKQVAIEEERDKLLAEKASWAEQSLHSNAAPVTDDVKRLWETERSELVKARDEALAELKVRKPTQYSKHYSCNLIQAATEAAQKSSEEARDYKRSSVRVIPGPTADSFTCCTGKVPGQGKLFNESPGSRAGTTSRSY